MVAANQIEKETLKRKTAVLLGHFTLSPKAILFLFNRYINTFKIKPPQRIKTFEELPIKETLVFNVSDTWQNNKQLISFYLHGRYIQRQSRSCTALQALLTGGAESALFAASTPFLIWLLAAALPGSHWNGTAT